MNYYRINLVILASLAAATLFALFGLPMWLLSRGSLWSWLLVPIALTTNSLWSLVHEAIHGNIHSSKRVNNWAGRGGAVLLGSSFQLLRFAHLMHHRFNRNHLDRPDIFDSNDIGRVTATVRYLTRLLIGHYVAEIAAPMLCLLPKATILRTIALIYRRPEPTVQNIGRAARQVFMRDKVVNEIRCDTVAAVVLVALSAWAYGGNWPILAAFLIGRGVLLSFFDNVYHFATPPDCGYLSWNLHLPAPFQLLILNMNLHQLHHRRPELPWWRLPARFSELDLHFDAGFLTMAIRQLSGPLPLAKYSRCTAINAQPDLN